MWANAECKIAFGLVGVGGYRAPINLVDSHAQGFYATRITLAFTCALPWLTSVPFASVTVSFENAASSVSVNVSVTSCGAALKAEPPDGLACEREACACATGALTISKSHEKATANDFSKGVTACNVGFAYRDIFSRPLGTRAHSETS